MKTILCYGDSLTWGYNPADASRYPYEQRWTGVLQQQLGSNYRVIEEGLNGRSTAFEDPLNEGRNGAKILPLLLESHAPLDLVILLLGTNDLRLQSTAGDIRSATIGCTKLIRLIGASQTNLGAKPSKILLLSPPIISKPNNYMSIAYEGTAEESQKFAQYYQIVADFFKISFLDTSKFIAASPIDGVHLDEENNKILGQMVGKKVINIFNAS